MPSTMKPGWRFVSYIPAHARCRLLQQPYESLQAAQHHTDALSLNQLPWLSRLYSSMEEVCIRREDGVGGTLGKDRVVCGGD